VSYITLACLGERTATTTQARRGRSAGFLMAALVPPSIAGPQPHTSHLWLGSVRAAGEPRRSPTNRTALLWIDIYIEDERGTPKAALVAQALWAKPRRTR
jgi:hypothetical protein